MHVTSFGHSCLLVESADARVLFDPGVFSTGFEDLRDVDAIVITHEHPDHFDVDRLTALRSANPGARVLAEPSVASSLSDDGHDAVTLTAGASETLGGVTVAAVGGEHATIHRDIPIIGNIGVLVSAEGEPTLFHPGDAYAATPQGVDLLAVPLTAPWAALKETVEFTRAVGAPTAIPIHDAMVSDIGRGFYLMLLDQLTADTEIRDVRGTGAVSFS